MTEEHYLASRSVTVGSLCSGYGGLDLGLQLALGVPLRHAWHVEYDKHPSAILAHHWPEVTNYGDVKTTDWTQVEPVDWLTAGYPCQPFSHAGKRGGSDDPRHLWPGVARAISVLRPRNVLLENVRGHVSLGLDAVLGDLAALGYDTRWGVVRAADAGAPHSRARIFIVASDADSGNGRGRAEAGRLPTPAGTGDRASVLGPAPSSDARGERHGRGQDGRSLGRVDGSDEVVPRERERTRPEPVDRSGAAPADAGGERRDGREGVLRAGWDTSERGEAGGDAGDRGGPAAPVADTAGDGRHEGRAEPARVERGPDAAQRGDAAPAWGDYEPAIRRWERVLGRPAPAPTEPGRVGERLSPRFVEWMMGLPAGWVTEVPGLPRNAQLKALGNGVVPQQCALALQQLGIREARAA